MANRERKETRKQETRPDSNPKARHTSTPVRRRVQRLEKKLQNSNRTPKHKRGLGVQGRQPSPLQESKEAKQTNLTYYYGSKSPKAREVRSKSTQQQKPHTSPAKKVMESNNKSRGPTAPLGR